MPRDKERYREWRRKWAAKPESKEWQRRRYRRLREQLLERAREYRARPGVREWRRENLKKWKEKNAAKIKAYQSSARVQEARRLGAARRRKLLTPCYVRRLLVGGSSLSSRDIPQGLVEAKMVQLKIRRALLGRGNCDGLTDDKRHS
jgi:hypothetical protein